MHLCWCAVPVVLPRALAQACQSCSSSAIPHTMSLCSEELTSRRPLLPELSRDLATLELLTRRIVKEGLMMVVTVGHTLHPPPLLPLLHLQHMPPLPHLLLHQPPPLLLMLHLRQLLLTLHPAHTSKRFILNDEVYNMMLDLPLPL